MKYKEGKREIDSYSKKPEFWLGKGFYCSCSGHKSAKNDHLQKTALCKFSKKQNMLCPAASFLSWERDCFMKHRSFLCENLLKVRYSPTPTPQCWALKASHICWLSAATPDLKGIWSCWGLKSLKVYSRQIHDGSVHLQALGTLSNICSSQLETGS